VIASGEANRKAAAKLAALKVCLKERGFGERFDYIGDNVADRVLWSEARNAYVVAISDKAARRLSGGLKIARRFERPTLVIGDAVSALRPFRWLIGLAIFSPILSAGAAAGQAVWMQALAAYLSLGLLTSAAGLLDDVLDIHEDRAQATARRQIFAEGIVEIPVGVSIALAMLALGLGIAVANLTATVTAMIACYFAAAMAYSVLIRPNRLIAASCHGLAGAFLVLVGAQIGQTAISLWQASAAAAIFAVIGFVGGAKESRGG